MTEIIEEKEDMKEAKEEVSMDEATSLTIRSQEIVSNIIKAETPDELQRYLDLFNMNQSKKDIIQIMKLNHLMDGIENQVIERFEKRPDQMGNRELLDFMQVVFNQIDKTRKNLEATKNNPPIQINNPKTDVNINLASDLDRDSKEKVLNYIQNVLKQAKKAEDQDIIDVETQNSDCIDSSETNSEEIVSSTPTDEEE